MTRVQLLNSHEGSSHQGRVGGQNTVKTPLTPKRARRQVENDDYAAFVRRILRAYARRVAAGDVEAILQMTDVATEFDTLIEQAVQSLHAFGYSWAEIGTRLGITRQAAQQHWGQAS